MISAISRFRVANGLADEVRNAFRGRPRLVDSEPGFLGMEVFTDAGDPTVFFLATRWTDQASFEKWHHGPSHRLSHALIPRGLRLDPSYTRVEVLDRLEEHHPDGLVQQTVADAVWTLARHLAASRTMYVLTTAGDGSVLMCSAALAERLGHPADALRGCPIAQVLVGPDAERLGRYLREEERPPAGPALLNFVDAGAQPFSVQATISARPDGLLVVGEAVVESEGQLTEMLLSLNNELTTLARENARQRQAVERTRAELERAYADLQQSHWHLRKIQEVLPICMHCHKVKTGDGRWDELFRFFEEHSGFLSHGYCPACAESLAGEWEQAPDESTDERPTPTE